ncbi:polysaccharide biosynthesis/export family protein [Bradyrhizobium sp. ORS 375]|uniref:polysaccharide biosynthesis/export family protein n=1 Tax=Bradyrhizobium sp. (strain ORS 375) TaxID=566679 RepID=UPI001FCBA0E2|nr:polysaccharide biosynthesis/export family protein [Bradyrhizobium sp. ORS 375]
MAAACTMMPASGPNQDAVRTSEAGSELSLPYALIKVTPEVERVLASYAPRLTDSATQSFKRAPAEIRFGVGDVVSVTIFEAAAGGLFIPIEAGVRPGNYVTIPNQNVDHNGFISVPYAGTIRAKGRTPTEVQQAIVDSLKNRAIEPQAVVTLVEQRTSLISVLGEVNAPSRFPANAAGERMLDAITRAGGPKGQGFDTWVMLEREGRRTTIPFGQLVYEPTNNVYIQPNDTIYVYREPQTFVAFGASGAQGQFNFDAWRISLAEGVAKAGGLNDSTADPAAVFLYRGESREVAQQLGIDTARFPGPVVPVIYNVNFRDPSSYFMATKFQMRNKDVVYISNAQSVESAKIMQYIRLVTATVNDPIVAAANATALRTAIKTAP